MRKICVAFGAALALMLAVVTGAGAAEEVRVTLVEVQGNRRIESATVLAKVKTAEGSVFSPAQIKEDIKALYQLGHFEDVQVKTEGFENGIKVIFVVKEKPLIREVAFEGNEEIDAEDLKADITILPRSAYNVQLLFENAEKIRVRYQDRGYYNAVVVPVVTELRGGDRNVIFYIEEGDDIDLSEFIITGNKALTDKEIRKPLKTQEHWFFSFLGRSGTIRTQELREDVETIRNLYYNKGYIQVQIDEPVIEPELKTKRSCWLVGKKTEYVSKDDYVVRINVREGDQFRVGSITVRGNTILSESELRREIKLTPGIIFSRDTLRADVNRIIDRYDSIARPFANVVPQFDIDAPRKTVAITIDIQEGGEVRIGRIDVTGNTKTRDKVIRREMRLDEGDLYNKKALRRSYERLYNLNYFESVDIVPERRRDEPVLDLSVKVKEKLTGTLSIGGGYSSVDGLIGIAEVTQGNFLGRGQIVKFKVQWGGERQTFVLGFTEPYLFDKPIRGSVDIYSQTQEYDSYSLRSRGVGLGLGKSYGEYVSASVRYAYDVSQTLDIDYSTYPPTLVKQILAYGDTLATSSVTSSLTRDTRDYFLDPKEGSRNSVVVEYAGLGGDAKFYKVVGDTGWYFPLFWETVFMVRGRAGYAGNFGDKPLPIGERFYVGGLSTVRGFKYGAAGPLEPSKSIIPPPVITEYNRIGGTSELIFNAEYTFPLVTAARLKGVMFYDIGRSFDSSVDGVTFSLSELRHSWGFGFRWLTPVGPLRFEWGYVINEKPLDQTSEFEFSIGTMF